MKIERMESCAPFAPRGELSRWSQPRTDSRATVVVHIDSDGRMCGWGEIPDVHSPPMFAPLLTGERPIRTEALWRRIAALTHWHHRFARPMVEALSAFDMAQWDIRRRADGKSVFEQMGGRIRNSLAT